MTIEEIKNLQEAEQADTNKKLNRKFTRVLVTRVAVAAALAGAAYLVAQKFDTSKVVDAVTPE